MVKSTQKYVSALLIFLLVSLFFTSTQAATNNSVVDLFTLGKPGQGAVMGNPRGSVTLVEFTDYNCGYCRRMAKVMSELIKKNTDLRVVVIDYPVVSSYSANAAAAALAANTLGKYAQFHELLMNTKGAVNAGTIDQAIQTLQLDKTAFDKAWHSPEITDSVNANVDLGSNILQLTGTPSFLVGKTAPADQEIKNFVAPAAFFGYRDLDAMQKIIDAAKSS